MADDTQNQNGRVRDERIRHLGEDVGENKEDIKILAREITSLKVDLASLSERMTLFQITQGIFTVIATGIAVYIASVVK